jgi:hypothetical protein
MRHQLKSSGEGEGGEGRGGERRLHKRLAYVVRVDNRASVEHVAVTPAVFALRKRTVSPARHVLEDISHQIRPKIDAGDASLLMGSIN